MTPWFAALGEVIAAVSALICVVNSLQLRRAYLSLSRVADAEIEELQGSVGPMECGQECQGQGAVLVWVRPGVPHDARRILDEAVRLISQSLGNPRSPLQWPREAEWPTSALAVASPRVGTAAP